MKTIQNILIGFDDNTTASIKYDAEENNFHFILKNIVIFKTETMSEALRKIELIYQ